MQRIPLIRGKTVIELPSGQVIVILLGRKREALIPDGATAKIYPAGRLKVRHRKW
jgi:hypothetical protein